VKLLIAALERGVLVSQVLQLEQTERHAIDEHQHIGAAVLVPNDRELVDSQPVVVRRMLEVDQPHPIRSDSAVSPSVLDRHALREQLVHAKVLCKQAL
jgi:hypothetical protein